MSLKDKTNALFEAAGADSTTRRLGVIRVIAEALAEDYGREYIRFTLEQAKARGNSEGIIGKILDELRKGRQE